MNYEEVDVVLDDVEILLDILSLFVNTLNGFAVLVAYYISRVCS